MLGTVEESAAISSRQVCGYLVELEVLEKKSGFEHGQLLFTSCYRSFILKDQLVVLAWTVKTGFIWTSHNIFFRADTPIL